jgi:hypothetical protein
VLLLSAYINLSLIFYNVFVNTSIFIPRIPLCAFEHVLVVSGYPLWDAALSVVTNRVVLYVVLGAAE